MPKEVKLIKGIYNGTVISRRVMRRGGGNLQHIGQIHHQDDRKPRGGHRDHHLRKELRLEGEYQLSQ